MAVSSKVSLLDRPSVSAVYAKVLLELLVERGGVYDELLQDIGVEAQLLNDTEGKVTSRQLIALANRGYEVTQDPNLGVWFGLQLKISTHGFLGYAAMSSDTLGEAIEMGVKYAKTRLGLLELEFFIEGDYGIISVDSLAPVDRHIERFFLQAFFTSFDVMGRNLIGDVPSDIEALCTYARPAFNQDLLDISDGKEPRYSQSVNQIRIPKRYLSVALGMSDSVSKKLMEEQCRKELVALGQAEDLLPKVKQLVNAEPGRVPKLEEVAGKCYMSSRTFKRRLAEFGISYQELVDNERQKKAADMLKNSNKSVDEIAMLLGYNDPSNFGRAFKRWFGVTPTQYRKQT